MRSRLFSDQERALGAAIAGLAYSNPFLPERLAWERKILGEACRDRGSVWHVGPEDALGKDQNISRINTEAEALLEKIFRRLPVLKTPLDVEEGQLYYDILTYCLYYRYEDDFLALLDGSAGSSVRSFRRFARDLARYLEPLPSSIYETFDPAHLYACFYQIRRAFHWIFRQIFGGSMASARLRANVWQSIFTHDMRRYRRTLWENMADVTTLITGPSGTGKELVARAVAHSSYLPFGEGEGKFEDYRSQFFPLNLSALSSTLIESELFGHCKGAFTGALRDRVGPLEACTPQGAVFLDEIGEVDETIQVKLLRLLQNREFQRLGDHHVMRFEGKIIAATNRDLDRDLDSGRMRTDFYYRLCADRIETPSLARQLKENQDDIRSLVTLLTRRILGGEEGDRLAEEVVSWIRESIPEDYPWPGNMRELEQCVRNVMVRRSYRPVRPKLSLDSADLWIEGLRKGEWTLEEATQRYITWVYAQDPNFVRTGEKLGIDRRTVKAKLDREWLESLGGTPPRE